MGEPAPSSSVSPMTASSTTLRLAEVSPSSSSSSPSSSIALRKPSSPSSSRMFFNWSSINMAAWSRAVSMFSPSPSAVRSPKVTSITTLSSSSVGLLFTVYVISSDSNPIFFFSFLHQLSSFSRPLSSPLSSSSSSEQKSSSWSSPLSSFPFPLVPF